MRPKEYEKENERKVTMMQKRIPFINIILLMMILSSVQLCYGQSSQLKKKSEVNKLFSESTLTDIDYLRSIEKATELLETAEADAEFGVKTLGLLKAVSTELGRLSSFEFYIINNFK